MKAGVPFLNWDINMINANTDHQECKSGPFFATYKMERLSSNVTFWPTSNNWCQKRPEEEGQRPRKEVGKGDTFLMQHNYHFYWFFQHQPLVYKVFTMLYTIACKYTDTILSSCTTQLLVFSRVWKMKVWISTWIVKLELFHPPQFWAGRKVCTFLSKLWYWIDTHW